MKDYTKKREQVFFCLDKKGYCMRFKPKKRVEKENMYNEYPFSIQVGFRSIYKVKIWLNQGLNRLVNPNTIPFDNPKHITSFSIKTVSLEVDD